MPLSDHEQKMLDQMEQQLAAEDPKFASQMQGSGLASLQRRRWVVGAVGALAGLGLVLVGISTTMWVGAIGFALMVASVAFAVTPRARPGSASSSRTATSRPRGGPSARARSSTASTSAGSVARTSGDPRPAPPVR
ncbi:DUF3040 domain-containing protein [Phycicoccus sp. HDW14]|uniref:DUF3040 domain-containing protein n=1 Tax=Phycicoccus sp. HDW14 TaxID=2714941 RepID=UPI00140DCDE6|nr:DUF3040 domain-containing protein [Phycicoccus sp. HDW14]QIM20724.1 DUF3040 domain-containing protein [Phycicoccus sp. HDW14]